MKYRCGLQSRHRKDIDFCGLGVVSGFLASSKTALVAVWAILLMLGVSTPNSQSAKSGLKDRRVGIRRLI